MALVVEDGTGLATAESYTSVSDADSYHTDHGAPSAWSSATTAAKETALRQASEFIDQWYGMRWLGIRAEPDQALDWPRIDGYYLDDNREIPWTVVPQPVKDATAVLALEALSATLLPDLDNPGTVKRSKVKVGSLEQETEYMGGNRPLKARPRIDGILRRLLRPTSLRRG